MASRSEPEELDFILADFLNANDEQESDWFLEDLITHHALPLVRTIIWSELRATRRAQDVDDIAGDVVLNLVKKLKQSKSNPDSWEGRNLRGFIAVTTYNACYKHLREHHPNRSRLKRQLRYILTQRNGLALWKGENGEWLCGFEPWQGKNQPPCSRGQFEAVGNHSQVLGCAEQLSGPPHGDKTAELLAAIFDATRAALKFDDLVDLVADLLKISDKPSTEGEYADRLPQPRQTSFVTEIEHQDYLQKLWAEICELPLDQRRALLLNLRDADGNDMIASIVHGRTANIRQIAEAVAMPAEEFAQMFNRLPLDDQTIGKIVGATRQRVINLRKAARRRLIRRTRELE